MIASKRRAKRRLQRYYDEMPLLQKLQLISRPDCRGPKGRPWQKSFASKRGGCGGRYYTKATLLRQEVLITRAAALESIADGRLA